VARASFMKINGIILARVLSLLLVFASVRAPGQAIVPLSVTNLVGSTVVLVGPSADNIVGYQWLKDGQTLADNARVSGSESAVLAIAEAMLEDTGTFTLTGMVDTNGLQTLTNFVVYVLDRPAIQSFVPLSSGGDVTFNVGATGGLLAYQWFWQGQPIPGATGSNLVFLNAYVTASAGYYSVLVTNPVGQASSPAPGLLFTKPAPQGTYQGLFFDPNPGNLMLGSSGFFQYTISGSHRGFTGKIVMLTESFPFSGAFSLAHDSQVTVKRRNRASLQLAFQLVTTNNMVQVIGTVSAETWLSTLRGNQLYYSARNAYPRAGKFALSVQETNFTSDVGPDGAGYGAVQIAKDGTVTVSGQAADGAAWSQSCGLSKIGDWPLYAVMYGGAGCMFGWLNVQPQAGSSIRGDSIYWVKLPASTKLYPGGISATLRAQGSTYVVTPGVAVLPFVKGVAAFTGGDLFSQHLPVWDFVKVTRPGPASFFVAEPGAENLALSVNRANGVVSGGFVDFVTGRRASIKGIILQQQNLAPGYFLSTNSSGYFTLAPSP
jgi:hypothetical protein